MSAPLLLISADAVERIRAGGRWGRVVSLISKGEHLVAIASLSNEGEPVVPAGLPKNHWLNSGDKVSNGRWYRVTSGLHAAWFAAAARRDAGIATADFKGYVTTSFFSGPHLAVTYAPDVATDFPGLEMPELLAWHVSAESATPMAVEVMPKTIGMQQLRSSWPVSTLAASTVMVVGTGSIGGAAAINLAAYGVGGLLLVDPDRLVWHNLVRHVSPAEHVGRLKVNSLKDQIMALRPDTKVEALALDVVADADRIHQLLQSTSAVLCTADGVAPRRVVSHLAHQARIDAVLACVLEDGAIGEVLRLRPWPGRGCLLCHRQKLIDDGGLDPEGTLEVGYGAFTRPMSAVGGDLHHVASLAAKATVASILERRGHPEQALPGEHAVIALEPATKWTPPFDIERTGEVRWAGPWPSRSGCVTCGAT